MIQSLSRNRNCSLSLSLSLSLFLDIDFEGENLLKISREGEITGDDTREREIDEGKTSRKKRACWR